MTCHTHGAHAIRPCITADNALAYAVSRWLPGAEQHELDRIRDLLREMGHDVLPMAGKANAT